ncbi:MAG: hypothetical protein AAF367_05235 [Pseudomonadota bacterium]
MIRFLKILLPIAAIGVFASLFLFSNARFSDGISFDGVDLSSLEEGLKLANPRFTGTTNRGEPFLVTAEWALPNAPQPTRVELSKVAGEFVLNDGRLIVLSADTGILRPEDKVLFLTTGAKLTTSDGYEVSADRASINARTEEMEASGEIMARGPIGEITSDTMRAARVVVNGDDSAYIWFEKRVRVRIDQPNMARNPG